MSNEKLKFEEINNEKLLLKYLMSKAINHKSYKIYTNISRAENILKTHAFYLSQGKTWNDITDRNNLNCKNNKQVNFAICFSYKKSEDVSMWMLYAGKNDGCMISMKKDLINDITKTDKIALGYFKDGDFKPVKTLDKNNFNIVLQDIVYYKEADKYTYNLKRPGEKANVNFKNIDFLKYFKKKSPWDYENECRLVVSIDKCFVTDKVDTIKIELDQDFITKNRIKIYKSPIVNDNIIRYEESNLTGEIDWDLCYGCKKKSCSDCAHEYIEIITEGK